MSILIKGMEMPERCGACFLRVGGCKQRIYMEQRPKYCPLVEIPTPHGNLKDESDIISLIEVMFCKDKDGMEHAIQCVKDAPTVIEAEGK